MCPLYNPICCSLSDWILRTCFSPVIIRLKPSGAPIALEKKSNLLESKGLLHLVPPSAWPLISTVRPLSGQPSIPLVLGPGELSQLLCSRCSPHGEPHPICPFLCVCLNAAFLSLAQVLPSCATFVTFYLSQGWQIGFIIYARSWQVKTWRILRAHPCSEGTGSVSHSGFCQRRNGEKWQDVRSIASIHIFNCFFRPVMPSMVATSLMWLFKLIKILLVG